MWTMMTQMPTTWHHDGHLIGLHWAWWLFWIAVVFLIVWSFWRLVRDERTRDREEGRRENAEEVLRRRYSEGEIDEDEFRHRMRVLGETGGSGAERPPEEG